MTHESDLTYLARAVFTSWTFIWFLNRVWCIDRFQALHWRRVKRFELKSAITLLLLVMCPLQILYDVLCTVIKYEEGFMPTSPDPPYGIISKPYQFWSPQHKSWVGPIDYILCMNFSVQTGLLFLLQSFWNYLANNLTKRTFMGSFEFKSYIVYSIFSLVVFPFLQYTFRGNTLQMELVPQCTYGVFQAIVAILGIRSDARFRELLQKNAASAQPHVYQKLEYFRNMNRLLTAALLIASTSLIIISVDGLTPTQYISSRKWAADFLITNVSFGLYMVFLSLMFIFYPSKNMASDSASIGKNSSISKRSAYGTQVSPSPAAKWENNNEQLPTAKPESTESSFVVDMGNVSINTASSIPSDLNEKVPSRPARPNALDMTCIQISPISPISPIPQFPSTPSTSSSSLQSPRSPPLHANTYPPLTPMGTAYPYIHSRPMESGLIRSNPPFYPSPKITTPSTASEFSFNRKNSVSSSEVPLISSRENSFGSIETPIAKAPLTPRRSPNRPPSISNPVIKITKSSRESLKDSEAATITLARKLNIRKSVAVVAPAVPLIEEEMPQPKGYVGSGAGIPPKAKPQSPKSTITQHGKRSSSGSLTSKSAHGAIAAVGSQAQNAQRKRSSSVFAVDRQASNTQRKRSGSNSSASSASSARNVVTRGASAPNLRLQNNTTKRSSLYKSSSPSVSSNNSISSGSSDSIISTAPRTTKRTSPPTSTYSNAIHARNQSLQSSKPPHIRSQSTRIARTPLQKEPSFTKQRPPPLLNSSSFTASKDSDGYASSASTPGSGDIGVAW